MHIEQVEIYSDAPNAAVMRHPSRQFPGCLIQGDSLQIFIRSLGVVQAEVGRLSEEAACELEAVAERLNQLFEHYKATLLEHDMKLPYYEPPHV